jgi:voltage-gated potassium channel
MAQLTVDATNVPSRPTGVRARYTEFIRKHERAWEVFFGLLAIVYVAVGFADNVTQDERVLGAVDVLEWVLTLVFVVEFSTRLIAARRWQSYLRAHWPDALALMPAIRGIRLLRLLRVLRFARLFSGMYRATSSHGRLSGHRDFVGLMTSWVGVGLICTIALYSAELDAAQASIRSPFDAVWWGVGALTTVGSDLFPVTVEGKLAAIALMIVGAFLFAAVTATMTSLLIRPASDRGSSLDLARLSRLHKEGELTDAEYQTAKSQALAVHPASKGTGART